MERPHKNDSDYTNFESIQVNILYIKQQFLYMLFII